MTNQQDAGGQEWEPWDQHWGTGQTTYWILIKNRAIAKCSRKEERDQIIVDHTTARDARRLEARVRELENTIKEMK